jgi:Helicase HerA, central domain
MLVKQRLPTAVVGLVVFTGLGALGDHRFWLQTWFYVGLGAVISATFVEPYFSRPQDAVVNAAAGIGAVASTTHEPVGGLWYGFLGLLVAIFALGVLASAAPESPSGLRWIAFRLSSRLGRATVVGTATLLLIVLTEAAAGRSGFEYLAGATAALALALTTDWPALYVRIREQDTPASAVAAIGPRMIMVAAGSDSALVSGDRVDVVVGEVTVSASVVARLPHRRGLRYQLALAEDWTAVCTHFPGDVILRHTEQPADVIGAASEASTDRRLEFEPLFPLQIGDPVSLDVEGKVLLYQVSRLMLVSSSWAGTNAVVPHAAAHIVGWPQPDGFIRGGGHLPAPHVAIRRTAGVVTTLPQGYYGIGRVKGTEIPVGMRASTDRHGHIAVLGMSGMGKTAVAQRICTALGASNMVVALDTTGEYVRRLGVEKYGGDLSRTGFVVHEPAGDPPQKAEEFVRQCMEAGANEYRTGGVDIRDRVILLEEAHSFVPEWNFALRAQQDHVGKTTRMIMQARKFGITFVIVSQRTAVVSKSALSQCENYIILKTIDQTSLDYLESVVGHDMRAAIAGLQRYEAVCVGPAFNTQEPVIVALTAPQG